MSGDGVYGDVRRARVRSGGAGGGRAVTGMVGVAAGGGAGGWRLRVPMVRVREEARVGKVVRTGAYGLRTGAPSGEGLRWRWQGCRTGQVARTGGRWRAGSSGRVRLVVGSGGRAGVGGRQRNVRKEECRTVDRAGARAGNGHQVQVRSGCQDGRVRVALAGGAGGRKSRWRGASAAASARHAGS